MKIATKLTKKVAEFVNENRVNNECYEYSESENFFHYPGIEIGWHESPLEVGYTKVSEQEFIDMVTAELFKEAQKPKEMKTKCIVLGQENEPVKELKKIELKECINTDLTTSKWNLSPSAFHELQLDLNAGKFKGMDFIIGVDEKGERTFLLGHWNDGVV